MTPSMGDKARDVVSGFEGTVLGEAKYLYSVAQVFVVPHGLKDGVPVEGRWFDVGRVEFAVEAPKGFGTSEETVK